MKSESGLGGMKEAQNVFIVTTQTVCSEQIYKLINVYVRMMCGMKFNEVVDVPRIPSIATNAVRSLLHKIQSRNCNKVDSV